MKPLLALSLLIEKKKPKPMNILVGQDSLVLKALEKKFDIKIRKFDEEDPCQFSYLDTELDIPLSLRESAAIWLNPSISKNLDAFKYLVAHLTDTPKEDQADLALALMREFDGIRDFNSLYWGVKNRSQGFKKSPWLKNPWEDPTNWTGAVDLGLRLSWLYTDSIAYVYAQDDCKKELASLGISAKKAAYLKAKKLSNNLMSATISELSRWKSERQDLHTALKISSIWS
jgi:hypothetical protein